MSDFLTVSEVMWRLGIRPRDVSDLFYQRRLDDLECPIIGGRRFIPHHYLPLIRAAVPGVDRAEDPVEQA